MGVQRRKRPLQRGQRTFQGCLRQANGACFIPVLPLLHLLHPAFRRRCAADSCAREPGDVLAHGIPQHFRKAQQEVRGDRILQVRRHFPRNLHALHQFLHRHVHRFSLRHRRRHPHSGRHLCFRQQLFAHNGTAARPVTAVCIAGQMEAAVHRPGPGLVAALAGQHRLLQCIYRRCGLSLHDSRHQLCQRTAFVHMWCDANVLDAIAHPIGGCGGGRCAINRLAPDVLCQATSAVAGKSPCLRCRQ